MSKEVASKTKTALVWDLAGSFFRQFASLIISIILARLLSPEEFGVIGMSLVFISITEVFIDIGFTSGLIQQREVKDIAYSSIFYVNLGISILLSLLIMLFAPYIADFYEEPMVGSVLFYLAFIPPIAALGRIQSTILTKKMDFRSLTLRNIFATVAGGIVGVAAAFMDFGVYSLVVQQITAAVMSTFLLWYATGWRPKLEFSFKEVKALLGYSSYVFFDQVLRQIFNKIDTIFIGKAFSTATLGFYSRAESLKAQIDTYTSTSLRKVMFPAFSALQQNMEAFGRAYFKAFNTVTGLIALLVAPIYLLSDKIIIGLLGEKWAPSIIFFQILLFSTLTSPHIGIMAQAVLAKGYSRLKFKMGLAQRLLRLTPILMGSLFGIVEFAIAVVVANTIVFFVYTYVVYRSLHLSFYKQLKGFIVPNIMLVVFVVLYHFVNDYVDSWILAGLFIIFDLAYLKIIKHESFAMVIEGYNMVKKKILKLKR